MTDVTIGFRAFDPHELLTHFVALRNGLYADFGIEPRLMDLTFADPVPADVIHVACGSVIMQRLRGNPVAVVLVAARGPVFWLVGRDERSGPNSLRGGRIAGFPQGSPPDLFMRILFREAGINPDADIAVRAARDDAARLGLLAHGDVDGALLSSLTPPALVVRLGFRLLALLSDHVRVPSSGLGVHESQLGSAAVVKVRDCHRQALQLMGGNEQLARSALVDVFHLATDDAESTLSRLRPVLSGDGTISGSEALNAIETTAAELGVQYDFGWDDFYCFRDEV